MTLSVTAKSRSFSNGTTEDAIPVDASFTELYNNDATIANYINSYAALNNQTNTFSAIQTMSAGINPAVAADPTTPSTGLLWYSVTNNNFLGAVQVAVVSSATNTAPISITTSVNHGLLTGQSVIISGILGNTAANGVFTITVTGPTTLTLNGSTGNGAYVSGGVVVVVMTMASTLNLGQYPVGFHGSAVPTPTLSTASGSGTVTVSTSSTTITFSTSQSGLIGAFITTAGNQTRVIVSGSGTSWTVNANFSNAETSVNWNYTLCTGLSMAYLHERDATNTVNMDNMSSCSISLTASAGLGGLDTGTVVANTLYYLYVVSNGYSVGLMLSTVNESVGGTISNTNFAYTVKRQLPFWLLTNPGTMGVPFDVAHWGGKTATILYRIAFTETDTPTTALTNVLSNGTATTWTTINCGAYLPSFCSMAMLKMYNTAYRSWVRRDGDTSVGYETGTPYSAAGGANMPALLPVSNLQKIDYKSVVNTNGVYIDVVGGVVTGVA